MIMRPVYKLNFLIKNVDFEKIVKSPLFLNLTSTNWLVLKIRLCFDT